MCPEARSSERSRGACTPERLLPVAVLQQRVHEPGRERITGRGSVDSHDPWRSRTGDLAAVFQQDGALFAERDREQRLVAHDFRLVAVGDNEVGVDHEGSSGGGVDAEPVRLVARLIQSGIGDLELAEDVSRRGEVTDFAVRARDDDNLILAVARDEDDRDAGWRTNLAHGQLDSGLLQAGECIGGVGVPAHTADHAHRRAEPRRGDRLVRALAARDAVDGRTGEGLPGAWQALDLRNEIEVDRPDDGQLGGHAAIVSSRRVETALVIVIEGAGPFDAVRRDFAVAAVTRGIPFHVTLLYPFAPLVELTDEVRAETRSFFAERRPFEFRLTHLAAWPRVVYAVPEPDTELRGCMQALFAHFPQWLPYGGAHDVVVPHATVGEDVDAAGVYAEIEQRVMPHLPHRCQAQDVALLEEFAPERWRELERFPLGR